MFDSRVASAVAVAGVAAGTFVVTPDIQAFASGVDCFTAFPGYSSVVLSDFNDGVNTEEELVWISWVTSEFNTDATSRNSALAGEYLQSADLDLGGCLWSPIGDAGEFGFGGPGPFTGSFDGDDFDIANLTSEGNFSAMFGTLQGAQVDEVKLVNVSISGDRGVAGLAYRSEGSHISSSEVTGRVSGASLVGGLVSIQWPYNPGSGELLSEISSSSFSGELNCLETCGGVLGYNYYGYVRQSFATGIMYSGAFTRDNWDLENDDIGVGGLIGYHYAADARLFVENVYSAMTIAVASPRVGGLVGTNTGVIKDAYALCDVSGNEIVGGFAGSNRGLVERVYSIGEPAATTEDGLIGGLVAEGADPFGLSIDDESALVSYWDTGMSGTSISDGGSPKSTAEMKNIETYDPIGDNPSDWDIETAETFSDGASTWLIATAGDLNGGYPFFSWQSTSSLPCESLDGDGDGGGSGDEGGNGDNGGDRGTGSNTTEAQSTLAQTGTEMPALLLGVGATGLLVMAGMSLLLASRRNFSRN